MAESVTAHVLRGVRTRNWEVDSGCSSGVQRLLAACTRLAVRGCTARCATTVLGAWCAMMFSLVDSRRFVCDSVVVALHSRATHERALFGDVILVSPGFHDFVVATTGKCQRWRPGAEQAEDLRGDEAIFPFGRVSVGHGKVRCEAVSLRQWLVGGGKELVLLDPDSGMRRVTIDAGNAPKEFKSMCHLPSDVSSDERRILVASGGDGLFTLDVNVNTLTARGGRESVPGFTYYSSCDSWDDRVAICGWRNGKCCMTVLSHDLQTEIRQVARLPAHPCAVRHGPDCIAVVTCDVLRVFDDTSLEELCHFQLDIDKKWYCYMSPLMFSSVLYVHQKTSASAYQVLLKGRDTSVVRLQGVFGGPALTLRGASVSVCMPTLA